MPTYHVEMLEGRTLEQKQKLVEAITRVSVEVLGGSPDSVDVLIVDVKRENWATAASCGLNHVPSPFHVPTAWNEQPLAGQPDTEFYRVFPAWWRHRPPCRRLGHCLFRK